MPTLHLLRHAKSSWDDPTLTDRSRPLNKRGRADAEALATHIGRMKMRPTLVLCSPALRTKQTLEAILPELGAPSIVYDETIYQGGGGELLTRLQAVGGTADSILLIGHNPGLEMLALDLLDPRIKGAIVTLLREKYPTGTLATLSTPVAAWRELSPGTCRLLGFLRPRDLKDN